MGEIAMQPTAADNAPMTPPNQRSGGNLTDYLPIQIPMSNLFVCYQARNKEGYSCTGNAVLNRHSQLRDIDDIRELQSHLAKQFELTEVLITTFQRMENAW
jgi:hypothetical protein